MRIKATERREMRRGKKSGIGRIWAGKEENGDMVSFEIGLFGLITPFCSDLSLEPGFGCLLFPYI